MKHSDNHPTGHSNPAPAPLPLHSPIRKTSFARRHIVLMLLIFEFFMQLRCGYAQAPQQFSFQGVARGTDGKILANTPIELFISIKERTPAGSEVFAEGHSVNTNSAGVFDIKIGSVSSLDAIKWGENPYYLNMIMTIQSLGVVKDLGTTQLLSVPYSLHASTSISAKKSEIADTAKVSLKWVDDRPIIQTGTTSGETLSSLPSGMTFLWYPKKSSLRFGVHSNNSWTDVNIGEASFAAGNGTIASGNRSVSLGKDTKAVAVDAFAAGESSEASAQRAVAWGMNALASAIDAFAFGENAQAKGTNSFAFGNGSESSAQHAFSIGKSATATGAASVAIGQSTSSGGQNAIAIGHQAIASGENAVSLGYRTSSKAFGALTAGLFNNESDNPIGTSLVATDRIFQIGNGYSNVTRSNALTILRNGNVGLGNNVLNPEYILDVGGRARIKDGGGTNTAGIYFNNSQNTTEGFVGMHNDNEIGLFIGNAWRLIVNKSGTVYANQFFTTSDERLKTNIAPIANSLPNLKKLNGYHYYWKDKNNDKSLQTGLLAQEVEKYFPSLVSVKEDGFKAVNYTGLIPHLIEAVKELDKKTDEIAALKKELASMQEMGKKLSALEASVKELLAGQGGNSTRASK